MFSCGVGETVGDGKRAYVLDRDLKFHPISTDKVNYKVSPELLDYLIK